MVCKPHAGVRSDGVVSRQQIAEVLGRSLRSNAAPGKTFELVAERGPTTTDIDAEWRVAWLQTICAAPAWLNDDPDATIGLVPSNRA